MQYVYACFFSTSDGLYIYSISPPLELYITININITVWLKNGLVDDELEYVFHILTVHRHLENIFNLTH